MSNFILNSHFGNALNNTAFYSAIVLTICILYKVYAFYKCIEIPNRSNKDICIESLVIRMAAAAAAVYYKDEKWIESKQFVANNIVKYCEEFLENEFLNPIARLNNLFPPLGLVANLVGMLEFFYSHNLVSDTANILKDALYGAYACTFVAISLYILTEFLILVFLRKSGYKRIQLAVTSHFMVKYP